MENLVGDISEHRLENDVYDYNSKVPSCTSLEFIDQVFDKYMVELRALWSQTRSGKTQMKFFTQKITELSDLSLSETKESLAIFLVSISQGYNEALDTLFITTVSKKYKEIEEQIEGVQARFGCVR